MNEPRCLHVFVGVFMCWWVPLACCLGLLNQEFLCLNRAAILNLRQSYSRLNIALVYSAVTRHLMQTVVDSCVQMVLVQ